MVKDKKENDAKEPEVSKEEALEEILEETPEAEVVDEREIPKDTGEETSEIRNIGGAMYRVVKTDTGTTFVPL
tara:strand:+ start:807 stop:1025 length:219 start_codon:yes stop_codon:yes gene_type:complete